MIISVTGTPGTGKTEVARELAPLLSYNYVDLNRVAEEQGLVIGMDPERHSKILDTDRFGEIFVPDNSVVDGHLSHLITADLILVLRTRPDVLKKRLEKRGWPEEKVMENVEAEILGVCSSESCESGEKVMELDTTGKKPEEVAKSIKALIDNNNNTGEIDWLEEYEYMLVR